jgi:MFS family permease
MTPRSIFFEDREYMQLSQAERDYQSQVRQDLPRNFAVHLVHGLLGQTGFRLVNTPTFVPAYILLLSGGSDIAVGLALSLQALGSALTPLLGASIIGHRDQVLPVGFWTGGLMRVAVLGLALAGFFLSGDLAVYAAIACLGLLGLFAGMQTVVFQVLLAKVIPVTNRGKLMGLRNFLAGITTAIVAWFGGNYLVGNPPTASGYAWIFLIAFILTSAGLLMLALVREPRPPTVASRQSLTEHLASMPGFLRGDPEFARYVLARALSTLGRMALPFYILYAGQAIGLSGQTLAVLTVSFTVAATASNLLWGVLADRYGFRLCMLLTIGMWIAATLALLLSNDYSTVILVFALIGASQEGFRLSAMSLAMEFGEREQIALRVATANTAAEVAGSIAPLIGGIVAAALGYGAVFIGAIACLLLGGALLLFRVTEPRHSTIEE